MLIGIIAQRSSSGESTCMAQSKLEVCTCYPAPTLLLTPLAPTIDMFKLMHTQKYTLIIHSWDVSRGHFTAFIVHQRPEDLCRLPNVNGDALDTSGRMTDLFAHRPHTKRQRWPKTHRALQMHSSWIPRSQAERLAY